MPRDIRDMIEEVPEGSRLEITDFPKIDTSYTKKDFICEYVLTKESMLGAFSIVEEAAAVWSAIEEACNEKE